MLGQQILWHVVRGQTVATYPFSYSIRPPSCVENSGGTPWGLHAIAEKHGADAPPGTAFVARQPLGHYRDLPDAGPAQKAYVTTRILWLRGLEPGHNAGPGVDSYARYIYIHGTNHPERFPTRDSGGCLLLRDEDLIALFATVPVGAHVWIARE